MPPRDSYWWEDAQFISRERAMFYPAGGLAGAITWHLPQATYGRLQVYSAEQAEQTDQLIGLAPAVDYTVPENPDDYDRGSFFTQRQGGSTATIAYSPSITTNLNPLDRFRIPIPTADIPDTLNGSWVDLIAKRRVLPVSSSATENWYDDEIIDTVTLEILHDLWKFSKAAFLPTGSPSTQFIEGNGWYELPNMTVAFITIDELGPSIGVEVGDPNRLIRAGSVAFGRWNPAFF
jgi:hypothetical protein